MASVEGMDDRSGGRALVPVLMPVKSKRPKLIILALFVLSGAAAATLAAEPEAAGPAGLALLAGVCVLGLVELALAPVTAKAHGRRAAIDAALDSSHDAIVLTSAGGEVLYANAAYRGLPAAATLPWERDAREGSPRAPAHAFAGDAALATALYRLVRAAEREGRGSARAWLAGPGGGAIPFDISAERAGPDGDWTLWRLRHLTDALEEGEAFRRAIDVISQPLAIAGLAALEVGAEGVVTATHGAIETVTGIRPNVLLGLNAPLEEVFIGDSEGDFSAPVRAGRYAARVAFGPAAGRLVWLYGPRDPFTRADGAGALFFVSGRRAVPLSVLHPQGDGKHVPQVAQARMFEDAPIGVALLDGQGNVLEANRSFRLFLGEDAFRGRSGPLELPECLEATDSADLRKRLQGSGIGSEREPFEFHLKGSNARIAQAFLSRAENDPAPGRDAYWFLYVLDTTEQKNLELQFAQSQKMQAVGQLAGGIAHDFNNILTAVLGFCDLLLTRHGAGDPSFADIDQIRQNATRAAALVRQLLAFSRQQTLMPKVIWLPDALAELKPLLNRLIGDRVQLEIKHDRELGLVKVDETQLDQVVINLAVNARDAMANGGTLTIRTANISREESRALGHELMPPADYVLIEVQDTGCGIPKEHLGKIFEPFFTTKEVGQGTGLGLSTVYGIVKQTNGFIFPDSEVGRGTVFRIYLPRHVETAVAPAAPVEAQPSEDHTGRGIILLVEDEDAVRAFASRALESRGYTVLQASNGEAALDLLESRGGVIDLLISDVVMPGMNGPTLVKTIRAKHPKTRIILISGYAEDAFRREMSTESPEGAAVAFLPKPFSLKTLINKVKEAMAAPA